MRKSCLLPFLFAFVLTAQSAVAQTVSPPPIAGTGYILVDFHSGQTIAENNADQRLEPASITKLMTAYIAFDAIRSGKLALDEMVSISKNAYDMKGSRMFIEMTRPVSVEDLLKGMIIQSGNDASVAIAEHLSGAESTFADLMNQFAKKLGLTNTNYQNATGWPGDEHYSTARDIAKLAAALIREFPQFYQWYSQKKFSYNGIEQFNRNTLLWRDQSVDGVKTGHTDSAGYCLVSSAKRDDRRLIAVVLGTGGTRERTEASQKLLNYGFRHFETHALYTAGETLTTAPVWKGSDLEVGLGVQQDLVVTIPAGQYENLSAMIDLQSRIVAPVNPEAELGEVRIMLGEKEVRTAQLYPVKPVEAGSLWRRAIHEVMLWFE